MEAKELRLNNLVIIGFKREEKRVECEITASDLMDFEINRDKSVFVYNPILLTDKWLLELGFENWGLGTQWNNEHESYVRYVRHNDLDGTSNFEIHYVKSTYGNTEHYQYIISCDEDDRLNWGEDLEYVHQLQNLYFVLTGKELEWKK